MTLRLEESYIKRAKIRAILEDKTVSGIIEEFLEDYAKKVDIDKIKKLHG